uniref:AAA_11 domain-containing protein n=1 Tax=Meloidogyne hapla TaxID=6305 RepID=A0A1I8BP52_MELHA
MKEMLECFRSTGGIIVGPNDIFPLKNGQFEEIKNLMFNVCKTNYRNFPSYFTKFRFLHYSRYLKNTIELKENNDQSTSNLIPNEIEQNLQRWEKALKLESLNDSNDQNLIQSGYPWMGISLICKDFMQTPHGYKIVLSTKKGKCFDIRYGNNYALNTTINLFGNREELTKQKGYDAMLYAFKCKQMPDYGDDPDISKLMPLHKNYDSSQLTALSALLNKNRPIVAIHGAAGTGKTLLLAQYLDIILKSDEYKNMPIAVISPSTSSLYRIIDFYCSIASKEILKEIPFIIMREFDGTASFFSIKNQNVQQLVKMASFRDFQRIYSEEIINILKELEILRKSNKKSSSQKISLLNERMLNLRDEEVYEFIRQRRLVFLTFSASNLQLLERIGVKFGGVIIDNAERLNEPESWITILKTSSFVRLFGDYHQSNKTLLNYNNSLLQKLDEDFGDSDVNFHLNRQYTANSAIRAWGDSVLYKEKKVIPADKSVEKMSLNEILKPNLKNKTPKLITEPLVLVDTSKLEGEWKESMFEGVSLTTATNFCNNCQCCSSNHLTAGQYSGNTINENEINSNHLSNSPQLTFSIPNAKPIPLIETENGLQKFYKIDYNGIESNLNKKTFFLPIPVAALIVQPNNLGCNCLKGKTPIIEENVPEENGCESRCEKCTNENETSEEGNNNCCDECLQQNILKKSKKEENKGEQHQFIFHQEPDINNNNKIPLEIFKNFVTKNREGVPENNKISNTFHEESLENLRGRLKDISDKMDLLKQLNAEMRSPLQQTQNHRIFPITKPEFYGKEEIENNNNLITSIGQSTEKDKQLGDNNNNIIIPEQQQKQLFFAPSMSENEQAIKRKIMAKTLTNPINNEEINKTVRKINF